MRCGKFGEGREGKVGTGELRGGDGNEARSVSVVP